MVIDDHNAFGAVRSLRPLEANAPLLIDSNAVLVALPVAGQGLQPIAGQPGQVLQTDCRFQYPQPLFGLMAEALKARNPSALGKALGMPVSVAPDHMPEWQKIRCTSSVQRRRVAPPDLPVLSSSKNHHQGTRRPVLRVCGFS
jgi:hypothetical protein